MLDVVRNLIALKDDRNGVTAVEYGIIAALMSAVLVIVFDALGSNLTTAFTTIGTHLTTGK